MFSCNDSLSQLVRVLHQIRAIRLDELGAVSQNDRRIDQIVRQVHVLEYEVCFVIWLTLQAEGLTPDNVVELGAILRDR